MQENQSKISQANRIVLPRFLVLFVLGLAACVPLVLYLDRMATFSLHWDDFPFVRDSLSWRRVRTSIWTPFSTHFCPAFRLWTWALVGQSASLSKIPNTLCMGAMVGLIAVLLLLFEFVRRETHSVVAGLVAVLAGGMTTAYFRAVALYATSQALWAMGFSLVVLLCVQGGVKSGRSGTMLGGFLASVVAPAWFSGGLLAGPVGSIYAWCSTGDGARGPRRCWLIAAPLLGTCLFATVALALAGDELLQPAHFGDRSLSRAFRPGLGAYLAARCLTEHVTLWNLGIQAELDLGQFLVYFSVLVGCFIYWIRRAPYRRLAICGLSLMAGGYLLVYSFRGYMGLEQLRMARWYVLFPHIGWTMFLVSGLDSKRNWQARPLTLGDAACLAALGLALFLLHRPVAVSEARSMENPRQREQLERLELIRRTSQQWRIDPVTIGDAIGPVRVSGSSGFDGLELIEPPTARREWTREEIRRGIRSVLQTGSPDAFGSATQRQLNR